MKDFLVSIVCICGFAFCLFLFHTDLNATLMRIGEKPVATITFRYNMAQRRFIDRLIWDRLRNESPLYNGDVIRTANMSEATITTIHEDIIDISSNTLIQIFINDIETKIDFTSGGMSVNASSEIAISSGNNSILARLGSILQMSKNKDGALDIAVSQGAASVNGRSLAAGTGVYINDEGESVPIPQTAAILPYNGARILSSTQSGAEIDFTWNKINYTQDISTRLEIAQDMNFNRLEFYADTGDSQLDIILPPGTWFWRLLPITAAGVITQEVPHSRLVIAPNPAPVLLSPREDHEIRYSNTQPAVRFAWTSSPDALSYNLIAANNPSLQNPALTLNVRAGTGTQMSVLSSELGQGTWYWRVTPVYSRNTEGSAASSLIWSFSIRRDAAFTARERNIPARSSRNSAQDGVAHRQIFPPDNYVVADNLLPDMRFTWKTDLENTRFQFSSERNFSNLLIDENAALESYVIRSMPSGIYYWRITGMEDEQSRNTQSRRITIAESLVPPSLGRAGNLTANQSDFIVISQRNQSVDFTWQRSRDADYYIFKLYRGDSSTPPILETTVFGTQISLDMSGYNDGTYTWTVQSMSRETMSSSRRTGAAASQSVTVRHLRPVVLLNPQNGIEYTGIEASRNPDTVRWASEEEVVDVVFVIARDERMRDIAHRRENVAKSFVMPRLTSGNYFWTIRAMTEDGLDISARTPFRIRVLPIPPLPVPANLLPADGHTVRPDHIRTSRSLNFSWSEVQGANGYIFTIFSGTGRGRSTVIQTQVLRETRYTVEDIRLLGRGTFFWQAEAVHVLDGNFVEQRGQLKENRLIVDIPVPRQVNTRDAGVLYGN